MSPSIPRISSPRVGPTVLRRGARPRRDRRSRSDHPPRLRRTLRPARRPRPGGLPGPAPGGGEPRPVVAGPVARPAGVAADGPLHRLRCPAWPWAPIRPARPACPEAGCSACPRTSPPTSSNSPGWPRTATRTASCRRSRLVRGPVLAGLRRADWAVLDGTQAALESLVVHTALRASRSLVAAGRPDRAAWALRRALVVSPYDERLYRAPPRGHRRPGKPGGPRLHHGRTPRPGRRGPGDLRAPLAACSTNQPWSACSTRTRRRSIANWWADGLRPEGIPARL